MVAHGSVLLRLVPKLKKEASDERGLGFQALKLTSELPAKDLEVSSSPRNTFEYVLIMF